MDHTWKDCCTSWDTEDNAEENPTDDLVGGDAAVTAFVGWSAAVTAFVGRGVADTTFVDGGIAVTASISGACCSCCSWFGPAAEDCVSPSVAPRSCCRDAFDGMSPRGPSSCSQPMLKHWCMNYSNKGFGFIAR